MSLPPQSNDQPYFNVSALEGGHVEIPFSRFIIGAGKGEVAKLPALSFLLRHSLTKTSLLFDLGVRRDTENFTPAIKERLKWLPATVRVPQDVVESLAKGEMSPKDVDYVSISHLHWDHIGDTSPFKERPIFLVHGEARPLVENGYPHDPASLYAADLFPAERTQYLSIDEWNPLGPFPRAHDYFGDGSLYFVDAPGHVQGHMNLLARTSPDGGWVYLAGDSAHDWRLLRDEAEVAGMHASVSMAKEHMARIRELMKNERVRVILAHDAPWYEANRGGDAFWPGKLSSL